MWRATVGIMSLRLNRLRTRLGLDNSRRTSCLVRAGGASPGWFRSPRQSARLTTLVMPARCLGSRRDHCFAVTRSFDDRAVAYESQRFACRAADEPILIAVDEIHGEPHPIAGRPQSHWRGLPLRGTWRCVASGLVLLQRLDGPRVCLIGCPLALGEELLLLDRAACRHSHLHIDVMGL